MNLNILIDIAKIAINQFDIDYIKTHNGPYFDEETDLRIKCHSICILSFLANIEKNDSYNERIQMLANKMISSENYRPYGFSSICRSKISKDKTNGVIGQAWIIEALIEAYKATKKNEYLKSATEIFLLHKFEEKWCVWHSCKINGDIDSVDMTFNHQLWFAAAGALIYECNKNIEIGRQVEAFCKHIPKLMKYNLHGLIKHSLYPYTLEKKIIFFIRTLRDTFFSIIKKPNMLYKENGYHSFNLYGLALLYNHGMKNFISTKYIKKCILYCNNEKYHQALNCKKHSIDINCKNLQKCELECNRYGYSYNVCGLELLYVDKIFPNIINEKTIHKLFVEQLNYTLEKSNESLTLNTEDPYICTLRVYEGLRTLAEEKK